MGILVPLACFGLANCIQRGYPLASAGQVDVRVDVAGALFAADTLDDKGKPVLPRQSPFETGATLYMIEGGAPAFGAFVTVRVEPRQALTLRPDSSESSDDPTCAEVNGSFRCTASRDGFARFVVSSQSDWSGTASIMVSWADQVREEKITVLPAGLPENATNFSMLIGGLDEAADGNHVLPTFLALKCGTGPVPSDLGSKWRDGEIRVREAYVRATPPSNAPGVVENAPVIVESLFSEAAVSTTQDCLDRRTRLRVLLDGTGESQRFFLCFSDIGGEASFAVSSGEKQLDPGPRITIDPEPHLLRVRALQSVVEIGPQTDLFEVSAYDVNRVRLAMPVDLTIDDDQVVMLEQASVTLDKEPTPATLIAGTPKAVGAVQLHVKPRLLSQPDCTSDAISIVEAP